MRLFGLVQPVDVGHSHSRRRATRARLLHSHPKIPELVDIAALKWE